MKSVPSATKDTERFGDVGFATRLGSVQAFASAAIRFLPSGRSARLLDLGCGEGALARMLQSARADIVIEGIDISAPSISRAIEKLETPAGATPISFVADDYMTWQATPFDVITADSVIHLIDNEDTALAGKLAADLVPGGLLIVSMPVRSARNAVLTALRALWRLTPGILDRLGLAVAHRVYPQEPREVLADRIGYMRMLPRRLYDERLDGVMGSAGLELVEDLPLPDPSLFKLRHRLIVWRRR